MDKTSKKLYLSIFTIVFLVMSLCVTSYALITASVSIRENFFKAGHVGINLNDGKEVISDDEFLFEPGMQVKKDFFVENSSSWDIVQALFRSCT